MVIFYFYSIILLNLFIFLNIDWYHVERVWKNAIFIAQNEKLLNENLEFDMEIIELAALFHDAVDFKYDFKEKSLEEIAKERLITFFKQHSLSVDKVDKIIYIILNVSWRKELENNIDPSQLPIELKIVRDADRLDSIGAIGVSNYF